MDHPSTSSLQLALVALFGASLVAISTSFIHKRTVDQVLDRLIEIWRKHSQNSNAYFEKEEGDYGDNDDDEGNFEGGFGSDDDAIMLQQRRLSTSWDDSMLRRYGISSSLPNVALRSDWLEEDAKFDEAIRVKAQNCSASSHDKLTFIPFGLPPLQVSQRFGEDQSVNLPDSNSRLASIGRLMTSRSPDGNAHENAEDSDEEGTELANEDDVIFNH